jgi:TRAP-type C4-dicarboxylate transport system substrate-binding protein
VGRQEHRSKANVELGAQINEVDKQGFIDAMKPVYEKHVTDDVLKKMVEDVKAVQ